MIEKHFLFRSMSAAQQDRLLQYIDVRKLEVSEPLVRQGETGRHFFVVDDGALEVTVIRAGETEPTVCGVPHRPRS